MTYKHLTQEERYQIHALKRQNKRSRIGDWEGDTIIGKDHQGVLVTLVERKSRYTLAAQRDTRHSAGVTQAVIELLRPHKGVCKTITV